MIAKLPRWVWSGAGILAFVAGMVNVTGLLGFEHQAVTHLTGTTSLLSHAVAAGDGAMAWRLLGVIAAFVAGSAFSGYVIRDSTLRLGRRYGVSLAVESLLLVVAVPLLNRDCHLGVCLASAACGLQNGMATVYSAATVRTTHLSGMFTDLGIYLGHLLRGLGVDWRRLKLCGVIITGFLAGGWAGSLAYRGLGYQALFIPAAITGCGAAAYAVRGLLRPAGR
ncbi:MAG: rane protein [Akkermansiaceae bacterium]|nr:rane protein [Akkermansiaceae bacterium]